jgi:hypothetical protein
VISLKTRDGRIHSANRWEDVLTSAYPDKPAGVTLGMLCNIGIKEYGIDCTFGQGEDFNPVQVLARLHECGIVIMQIAEPPIAA